MNPLLFACLAIIALALAGVIYQRLGLVRDARRFPPPGTLLDVGGYRLHVVCRGIGAPAVVLESAIAGSSLSWSRVQPDVARFTSACSYDRAGLGWSDAPALPYTFARVVDDLHAVVARTRGALPCVIVGHSFGAVVCLAYAAQHPPDVAGLVLLDPPSEWLPMTPRQTYLLRGAIQLSRFGGVLARVGVVRACLDLLTGGQPAVPRRFVKVFGPTVARTLERLVGEVRKLPSETHPLVQAAWSQPKCFRALADHLRLFPEAAVSVARLPARQVPLVVISSGGQPPDVLAAHRALAEGSPDGRHVVASKSGHWVQFDEPELVVDSIRRVVEAARRTNRPEPTAS